MKRKITMPSMALLILTALLALLALSCDFLFDLGNIVTNEDRLPELGENEFYAQNMSTNKYYKVKAEKLAIGKNCVIWVETGSGVSRETAEEFAYKYDNDIRNKILGAFGMDEFLDIESSIYFDDILHYANYLAESPDDRKLTVLLLNIKDGYKDPKTDSYVAGYFFSGNFWSAGYNASGSITFYSNARDMIYIDTYPGLSLKPDDTYATFAHELQHLINWVTAVQMGKRPMDTWIDEGLSSQAEHIYYGSHPTDKCEWFKKDPNKTLAQGNNFFAWGNRKESPLAILDDYATVYMFFRWLYLQADTGMQQTIFREITTSNYYDHNIIANLAQRINPEWNSWEAVLRAWMVANYFPKNAYGYKNDSFLQDEVVVPRNTSGTTIMLYPGEGVYSPIQNSYSPGLASGGNIRYVGVSSSALDLTAPYTGQVLLTFNANTDTTSSRETGSLTGRQASVSRMADSAPEFAGPYALDARDVLGRDQFENLAVFSRDAK